MRLCFCLYYDVPDERRLDIHGFRYTNGGTVLIHGFIFSNRGDA
jgi:hypothetical protein